MDERIQHTESLMKIFPGATLKFCEDTDFTDYHGQKASAPVKTCRRRRACLAVDGRRRKESHSDVRRK
jgi:hypothetical protein